MVKTPITAMHRPYITPKTKNVKAWLCGRVAAGLTKHFNQLCVFCDSSGFKFLFMFKRTFFPYFNTVSLCI